MGLSLQELGSLFEPLQHLSDDEETFEVAGLRLTLRTLAPEEEIAVQRHARAALAEGDAADQTTAFDYLDRLRLATLGYALVQVNERDFRGEEFVLTGEKTAGGVAVKVRKNEAIMQLAKPWGRSLMTAIYRKFRTLTQRVDLRVRDSISFDRIDYDAEIARLEELLAELREDRAAQLAEGANLAETPEPPARAAKPVPAPVLPEPAPAVERQLVEEEQAAEPPAVAAPAVAAPAVAAPAVAAPAVVRPSFNRTAAKAPAAAPAAAPPPVPPPVVTEALEAPPASAVTVLPPHLRAAQAAAALSGAGARGPVAAGTVDGVEVFELPTQDLTGRGATTPRAPEAPPTLNPNFRPRR